MLVKCNAKLHWNPPGFIVGVNTSLTETPHCAVTSFEPHFYSFMTKLKLQVAQWYSYSVPSLCDHTVIWFYVDLLQKPASDCFWTALMTSLTMTDICAVAWWHLSAVLTLVANHKLGIKWGCQLHCSVLTGWFKWRSCKEGGRRQRNVPLCMSNVYTKPRIYSLVLVEWESWHLSCYDREHN